jgi:voltage-gated potassium channel
VSETRPVTVRVILVLLAQIVIAQILLLLIFALLPEQERFGADGALRVVAAVALVCVVLALQIRMVTRAERPTLRAIRAIATVLTVLILSFASTYLAMSHSNSATFSQPLDKISSVYFSVTIVATVGFGDITPRTDPARVVVTIQMVLDLIFLATAGRSLFARAERQSARRVRAE